MLLQVEPDPRSAPPHLLGLQLSGSQTKMLHHARPGWMPNELVLGICSEEPSQNMGWWDLPPSLRTLCHDAILLPGDLKGLNDILEIRKKKTLALAKALQGCCEQSGRPYSMMHRAARDLQWCMADLMQLGEEDVLEKTLLEPADNMPVASRTPAEEAILLDES